MAEKRRSKRHPRRLRVRFGEPGLGFTGSGFTNDVSATGLFVSCGQSPKPGTRLHLEVTLAEGRDLFIEGVVSRQAVVPPELRSVVKAGFALRYLLGTELMAELVPSLSGPQRDDPFCFVYGDEATWRGVVEGELQRGGLFAWCTRPVALNSVVTATFDLKFLGRQLAFEARVVHVLTEAEHRHGVALMFLDGAGALAAFNATLGQ